MSLDEAAHYAQTGGLILLSLCFLGAVFYALWPSNRDKFSKAAHAPLEDGDDD